MKPVRLWTFTLLMGFALLIALGSLLAGMIFFAQKGSERSGGDKSSWQERVVKLGAQAGYRITPPEKKMTYEGGSRSVESIRFSAYHEQDLPGGSFLRVAYIPSLKEYRVDFVNGGMLVFAHFGYDPETQAVLLRTEKESLSEIDVEATVAGAPLTRRQVEEQIAAVFELVKRAGGP